MEKVARQQDHKMLRHRLSGIQKQHCVLMLNKAGEGHGSLHAVALTGRGRTIVGCSITKEVNRNLVCLLIMQSFL